MTTIKETKEKSSEVKTKRRRFDNESVCVAPTHVYCVELKTSCSGVKSILKDGLRVFSGYQKALDFMTKESKDTEAALEKVYDQECTFTTKEEDECEKHAKIDTSFDGQSVTFRVLDANKSTIAVFTLTQTKLF